MPILFSSNNHSLDEVKTMSLLPEGLREKLAILLIATITRLTAIGFDIVGYLRCILLLS